MARRRRLREIEGRRVAVTAALFTRDLFSEVCTVVGILLSADVIVMHVSITFGVRLVA